MPIPGRLRPTRFKVFVAICLGAIAASCATGEKVAVTRPDAAAAGGAAPSDASARDTLGTGGLTGTGGLGASGGSGAAGGTAGAGAGGSRMDAIVGGAGGARADGGDGDASPSIDAGCAAGDCCPDDPEKTEPGECGCGMPDIDSDGDLTLDCNDQCPEDPNKTSPRVCGCGLLDNTLGCPQFSLVHRYRFDGTGTDVVDSKGNADGMVVNTTLTGSGTVDLTGGTSDEYVSLPAGIVSALTDATFETWLTWNGGDPWQRIFDFGDNDGGGAGEQGPGGLTYLMLTPASSSDGNARGAFTVSGGGENETVVNAGDPLPTGAMTHVAVVVDQTAGTLGLYVDGASSGSVAFSGSLGNLNDVNNWLGRSQYSQDPELVATLHEFRIYNSALTADLVQMSYAEGPDAP